MAWEAEPAWPFFALLGVFAAGILFFRCNAGAEPTVCANPRTCSVCECAGGQVGRVACTGSPEGTTLVVEGGEVAAGETVAMRCKAPGGEVSEVTELTYVPEPSRWVMLAVGCGLLTLLRIKK